MNTKNNKVWAGNKQHQEFLIEAIMELFGKENPTDLAGAIGTVVVNTICDLSPDKQSALDGFKAWCGDMEEVIDKRF